MSYLDKKTKNNLLQQWQNFASGIFDFASRNLLEKYLLKLRKEIGFIYVSEGIASKIRIIKSSEHGKISQKIKSHEFFKRWNLSRTIPKSIKYWQNFGYGTLGDEISQWAGILKTAKPLLPMRVFYNSNEIFNYLLANIEFDKTGRTWSLAMRIPSILSKREINNISFSQLKKTTIAPILLISGKSDKNESGQFSFVHELKIISNILSDKGIKNKIILNRSMFEIKKIIKSYQPKYVHFAGHGKRLLEGGDHKARSMERCLSFIDFFETMNTILSIIKTDKSC